MASFAKVAALLCVLGLISAPALEARELKAALYTIEGCRCAAHRTARLSGVIRVVSPASDCARCGTGYSNANADK